MSTAAGTTHTASTPTPWVQLSGAATAAAVSAAATQLSTRPRAVLSVFDLPETDLGFLADLPALHELRIGYSGVRSVQALAHHAQSLQSLTLMLGRHALTVQDLAELKNLRQLYLSKHGRAAVRDVEQVLPHLHRLEHLVLHGVSVPTLDGLSALPSLRALALKLGTAPQLQALAQLPALRFFEAWQVRGMKDLSALAASSTLEVLYLESLRHAQLPDFSAAVALQHVQLDNLPLSEGVNGLAAAPQLRQLSITRRLFELDEVAPLRRHPTLQAAFVSLRGRGVSDRDCQLGLRRPDPAPFSAYAAGVMGLPDLTEEGAGQ
ncbi:leucine-rich repeat domain-containing protein [Kineococcus sp. SYSU DK005]|uniref:hypothetical protein n=1 Tax=Kineococcus sp. SYSU DK005 TaxID=3383126 RepID=UPI003D7C81FB